MKKLTLIILAVALAGAAANADDFYFCYTSSWDELVFAKIPGPGTYDGLDIVHRVSIPCNSDALTYDGEYWWIFNYLTAEIYCFDQNGDYVRSFPRPVSYTAVRALGWDGEYLWVEGDRDLYQRDIYGGVGPYGTIEISEFFETTSCTIKDDRIIIGNSTDGGANRLELDVYDFAGNFLFNGYEMDAYFDEGFGALAYHDGIVWVSHYDHDYPQYNEIYGLEYREGQDFIKRTTIENVAVFDLTICDADFINIASSSLGKIKAYFADK